MDWEPEFFFFLKLKYIKWAEQLVPENVNVREVLRWVKAWFIKGGEGSSAVISYKQTAERANEASQMSQQTVTAV